MMSVRAAARCDAVRGALKFDDDRVRDRVVIIAQWLHYIHGQVKSQTRIFKLIDKTRFFF